MSATQSLQSAAHTATPADNEARAWLIRLDGDTVSPAERQRFEHWLKTDPAHEAAYARASRLWHGLSAMRELEALEPLERLTWRERFTTLLDSLESTWTGTRRRRLWIAPAALSAAVAMAALLLHLAEPTQPGASQTTRHITALAQMRELQLPDGSVVTLGAKSVLETDFSAGRRHATLIAGEAFFDIAADAARPFMLTAGDTLVRVLGTRFNVNHSTAHVRIDVMEGSVQISRLTAEEQTTGTQSAAVPGANGRAEVAPAVLTAGQHLIAAPDAPLAPVAHDGTATADAWREGRLVYFNARLEDIVADANRYWPQRISLASPALSGLRLTASFRTDEIDSLLKTLGDALPVSVERRKGGEIFLNPRTSPAPDSSQDDS